MIPALEKPADRMRPAGFSVLLFPTLKGRLAPQRHCGRRQLFVAAGRFAPRWIRKLQTAIRKLQTAIHLTAK